MITVEAVFAARDGQLSTSSAWSTCLVTLELLVLQLFYHVMAIILSGPTSTILIS